MAIFELNPALVYSILAVIPPAAVFFVAYGRYDGAFRDNVVFLYFMGGILMGFLLGFLTVLALGGLTPLFAIVMLALLYPVTVLVGINRRKWQGERHAVFNGGAFGIGLALMLAFTFLYVLFARLPLTWAHVAQALLFVSGVTGVFFGLGLLAGDAVRRRKPFRMALAGTAIVLVPVIFLVSFVGNVSPPAPVGAPAPWNVEAPLAQEVSSFEGAAPLAILVPEVAPANATAIVRVVNATGEHVTRGVPASEAPTNVTFDVQDPGFYRVEAWIETDGNGRPDPEERWGVLLDGEQPVGANSIRVDEGGRQLRLDFREAPSPQGWTTAERLVEARETPPDPVGVWLWPTLLAAYGLVFAVAGERRLMIEGVSEEARRERRRRRRAGRA